MNTEIPRTSPERPIDMTPEDSSDYSEYEIEYVPTEPSRAPTQEQAVDVARQEVQQLFGDTTQDEPQEGTMIDMHEAATWDMATARERLGTEFDHSVEVDGKIMNVNVRGEGDKYVVVLPGRGVTAPSCDFAPLIAQLKDTHRVVTIEPFGSGLSDMTDKPRTSEQLIGEYHEALKKLGIDRYVLAAHSISGLHGLHYANEYPDEVQAFVGIDTATPGMNHFMSDEFIAETSAPVDAPPWSIQDDIGDVEGYTYSPEEITKMRILHELNDKNDGIFEGIKERYKEWYKQQHKGEEEVKPYDTMKFPATMPTAFFLSTVSTNLAPWYEEEHVNQLTKVEGSSVEVLPGDHFLHHNQAAAIAGAIKSLGQK